MVKKYKKAIAWETLAKLIIVLLVAIAVLFAISKYSGKGFESMGNMSKMGEEATTQATNTYGSILNELKQ